MGLLCISFSLRQHDLLAAELPSGDPLGDQSLQLDDHPAWWIDLIADADAVRAGLYRPVYDRRADRPIPGCAAGGCAGHRHLMTGLHAIHLTIGLLIVL